MPPPSFSLPPANWCSKHEFGGWGAPTSISLANWGGGASRCALAAGSPPMTQGGWSPPPPLPRGLPPERDGDGGSPAEAEPLPLRPGSGAALRRAGLGGAAGGGLAGDGGVGPADLPGRRGGLLQPALVGLLARGQPGGASRRAAGRRGAGLAERRRLEPGELAGAAFGSPGPGFQRPLLPAGLLLHRRLRLRLRPVSGRPPPRPLRRLRHQQHQRQPPRRVGEAPPTVSHPRGPKVLLGPFSSQPDLSSSSSSSCSPARRRRRLLGQRRHDSPAGFDRKP